MWKAVLEGKLKGYYGGIAPGYCRGLYFMEQYLAGCVSHEEMIASLEKAVIEKDEPEKKESFLNEIIDNLFVRTLSLVDDITLSFNLSFEELLRRAFVAEYLTVIEIIIETHKERNSD